MPTYEYLCDACEHQFDEFQSITDKPLKKCPVCGKPKLRRLFGTGAAVLFKGSGFYETDYRSESYKAAAKAEAEKAKPAASDSDGKADKSSADGKASKDGAASSTNHTSGSKSTKKSPKSKT
jgi:putative FmdB family regulatory protein